MIAFEISLRTTLVGEFVFMWHGRFEPAWCNALGCLEDEALQDVVVFEEKGQS